MNRLKPNGNYTYHLLSQWQLYVPPTMPSRNGVLSAHYLLHGSESP